VGPDMVRPQVADGWTALRYGGYLRIYSISSREQPRRCGPSAWRLGGGLTTPHCKKKSSLRSVTRILRIGISGGLLCSR
jgi:hypothetical protein